MNVGQICQRDAVIIGTFENLTAAAQLMREKKVDYMVVVETTFDRKFRPVGVLTCRDIVVSVVAREADSRSLRVDDVMSPDPLVALLSDSVNSICKQMRRRGVRRIPVVGDSGELVGLLSLEQIVDALIDDMERTFDGVKPERPVERSDMSTNP